MTMQLCCRDVGLNCDFEARGNTEEEVLQKGRLGARTLGASGHADVAGAGEQDSRRDSHGVNSNAVGEPHRFSAAAESAGRERVRCRSRPPGGRRYDWLPLMQPFWPLRLA